MQDVRSVVVVSDTHCGCRLGLCPDEPVPLDDGGTYQPSRLQQTLWAWWQDFWHSWVPRVTKGEPYCVVMNGDALDGVHHGSVTQVSHNIEDQVRIAHRCLAPVVDACEGRYYHIRGTEAHVGKSGQDEERLAKTLGAIPNDAGQFARWDLWKRLDGQLIHFLHHVGTTGSSAYEMTAIFKELVESYVEAGRWGDRPPDVVARSHRHRYAEARIASGAGYAISFATPCWQLKTPFVYKVPGARQSQPQIGGVVIRLGDEDGIYTRARVWRVERPREE